MVGKIYMSRTKKLLALGIISIDFHHYSPIEVEIRATNCRSDWVTFILLVKRVNGLWQVDDYNRSCFHAEGKWKHLGEVLRYIEDNANLGEFVETY